jgi:O-antigen ligase
LVTAIEVLLAVVVVGSVFALGAVRPWAYLSVWIVSFLMLGLAGLALLAARSTQTPPPATPLLWPGLALAGWGGLALLPFPDWPLRTLSAADTGRGLVFLLSALALHVSAAVVLREPQARDRLRSLLSGTGLLLALAALAQFASGTYLIYGFVKPDAQSLHFGPFWNRNHYASYMLMIVPLTLSQLSAAYRRYAGVVGERRDLRRRLVALLVPEGTSLVWATLPPLATIVSLMATTSRGGLLSLLGGLATAHPAPGKGSSAAAWRLAVALLLAGSVFVGWGVLSHRFAQVGDELRPGSQGRLSIWRASLEAMDGSWLTGSGFNTFPLRVREWLMYPAAHNQYLQLLVETGLPGLALGLWGGVAALRAVRHDPWLRAAIVGVLLHSFVEFSLQIPAVAILFVTLAAWPASRGPAAGAGAPATDGP